MAYSKVFFHGAGNGIGDMMRTLDAAGIPFTIKSISNEGFIEEGLNLRKASGVLHNLIYRDPNPGGHVNDEPNYNLPPSEAALAHWNVVEASLPATVKNNRDAIWVEPVNEIDTHTHAEWLGQFCFYLARYAVSHGYRVLLAGFNAGQPDIGMWELYFRPFLELCAAFPDKIGVSLHEGKLGPMNVPAWDEQYYPWTVGRFEFLMEECDNMGIGHPTTFISEWAWSYNDVPSVEMMMRDVAWYSPLVSKYPTIHGVCLWNLDPGWGGATDKLPNLIPKITNYTLYVIHPDPVPPIPDKSLEEFIWDHSKETQAISLNPDAALQKAMMNDGRTPVGTEIWVTYDGERYAYMAGETVNNSKPRKVYMTKVPNWNSITGFTDPRKPSVPIPPIPLPPKVYVMPKYFYPPGVMKFGDIVILDNNWHGGAERQQLQEDAGKSYVTKNTSWERRVVDDKYIYLEMDTSPGAGQYYTTIGTWMPRYWSVGQVHKSVNTVKFFRKIDCAPITQYQSGNHLVFAEHYGSWKSPNDFVFSDVVRVEWVQDGRVDETYWYAAGIGLIRWLKYDGRQSNVVQHIPYGQQGNNEREKINCS